MPIFVLYWSMFIPDIKTSKSSPYSKSLYRKITEAWQQDISSSSCSPLLLESSHSIQWDAWLTHTHLQGWDIHCFLKQHTPHLPSLYGVSFPDVKLQSIACNFFPLGPPSSGHTAHVCLFCSACIPYLPRLTQWTDITQTSYNAPL